MAVVNVKSAAITNRDATPAVLNSPHSTFGFLQESVGYVAVTSGDSIASIYRMCQVPTNARIASLKLSCTAITTCAADIGAYRVTSADGTAGAVVDVDFFATAQSLASVLINSDVINESTTNTPEKQAQPLWQALGEASDPGGFYDLAITLTAAAGSGGSMTLKATFVD